MVLSHTPDVSGVPQGTVLAIGPLFFSLHINGINAVIEVIEKQ